MVEILPVVLENHLQPISLLELEFTGPGAKERKGGRVKGGTSVKGRGEDFFLGGGGS